MKTVNLKTEHILNHEHKTIANNAKLSTNNKNIPIRNKVNQENVQPN